jgi:hypothetical protein
MSEPRQPQKDGGLKPSPLSPSDDREPAPDATDVGDVAEDVDDSRGREGGMIGEG